MGCQGSSAAGASQPQASSSKSCSGTEAADRKEGHVKDDIPEIGGPDYFADDVSTALPPSGQTSTSSQEHLDVVVQAVPNEAAFAAVLRAATATSLAEAEGKLRDLRFESSVRPAGNILRSVLKGVESENLPRRLSSRRVSFSETLAEIVPVEPLAGYPGILQRSSAVDNFFFRDRFPLDEFVINQDPLEMASAPCRRQGYVNIDVDDSDRLLPPIECFSMFCCVDHGHGELISENGHSLPVALGDEEHSDFEVAEAKAVTLAAALSPQKEDIDADLAITDQVVLS